MRRVAQSNIFFASLFDVWLLDSSIFKFAFSCTLLWCVILVEIHKENPDSHRYAVGRGRNSLIAFSDNSRHAFCMPHANPTRDGLFLSFFLIHLLYHSFCGWGTWVQLSYLLFAESHQLHSRSQLGCVLRRLAWEESASILTQVVSRIHFLQL